MKIKYFTPWPEKEKNRTPFSWVDLIFEWYEDAMVFHVFIFIYLFETNGKKGNLNENDLRLCYGNFSKVPFWKIILNNYELH